jgi:hypothetical protein
MYHSKLVRLLKPVEMTDSNSHASYEINYGCKKFYDTRPRQTQSCNLWSENHYNLSGAFPNIGLNYNKKGFIALGFRDRIHNTSFSSQLTNGPSKLECYIV